MRVLVLGGNGFIGSHVVDILLKNGHSVRVFDRAEDRYRGRLVNVDYLLGSFDDSFLISEALVDIDVVFHGISTTVPGTSNVDPIGDIQTNLVNTLKLLKAMQDKEIKRIVYISSGGTVYGPPTINPIPETHALNPICSYGIVKIAIENYLYMHQELYGLRPIVLRASNPYGERQGHQGVQGVIGTFLYKAYRNEPIEIWGDGGIIRDFIHIHDLSRACLNSIESDICGVFNLGSGLGHSVNDVLNSVKSASKRNIKVNYKPARGFDISKVVLNIDKIKSTFDYSPQIDLDTGVFQTWEWINKTLRNT